MESDFQFFSFTHQLVRKMFLFYIFYTNVTKRWEEQWLTVHMLINGRGEEDGGPGEQKPHGLYGNIVGSGPWSQRRVVIGLYSWGAMAPHGRCKLLRGPSGRERRREKEQKTRFLRKEPNECMACPVSVKQRFNTAAFSSRPPPGRS